jgi:hypothetical protein
LHPSIKKNIGEVPHPHPNPAFKKKIPFPEIKGERCLPNYPKKLFFSTKNINQQNTIHLVDYYYE